MDEETKTEETQEANTEEKEKPLDKMTAKEREYLTVVKSEILLYTLTRTSKKAAFPQFSFH